MISKAEILVDAIGSVNNYHRPDSLSYSLKSPLLLKSFAKDGKHIIDSEGHRVFSSGLSGLKSSIWDLELKINGKSNSGIKTTDTLRNLLKVYGLKSDTDMTAVVSFLRKALRTGEIDQFTPLSYFIDDTFKNTLDKTS